MKTIFTIIAFTFFYISLFSQVISTNRNPVGLESNFLFNAQKRFSVSQTGAGQVSLPMLFDGNFSPSYTGVGISTSSPTVITIAGLPNWHTQAGAWVGWTTRYWPARRFKIEGYEVYTNNKWITLADYSGTDYSGSDFIAPLYGSYTQLRFTFYEGTGDGGRFGLSEIFFIHPEATTPYLGLLPTFNSLTEVNSNILIGKTSQNNSTYKLDVGGKIRADEVVVNSTGADFVFEPAYQLRTLADLEIFISANKHLPEIASAEEMQNNGVNTGEMQTKLLQKQEETFLYLIEHQKILEKLKQENIDLKKENESLKVMLLELRQEVKYIQSQCKP